MNEVIDLHGTAYERGRIHGSAQRAQIHAHLAALFASFHKLGTSDPAAYVARMLAETSFRAAIDRHAPHLLDEVRGIAEGAELAFDQVYAMQLIDEEWAYRIRTLHARAVEKCSSLAIRDSARGQTWIGQNMDLGAYTDGFQMLTRHAPVDGRPGALLFSIAGVIGLMGVNDAGVGVCLNSLPQLPSADHGIPVAFMLRHLLESRSARDAAERCRTLPHATNQHYLIADPREIVSIEASSSGTRDYQPVDATRVFHTNHPLADGDDYSAREPNSNARLRSLSARLAQNEISRDVLGAALSSFDDPDHPVCRLNRSDSGHIGFTTGSMLSALSPNSIESFVSFGPPSLMGYRHVAVQV